MIYGQRPVVLTWEAARDKMRQNMGGKEAKEIGYKLLVQEIISSGIRYHFVGNTKINS